MAAFATSNGSAATVLSASVGGMIQVDIAALIDHTLLKPEATMQDIAALCEVANQYRVAAICVSPSRLPVAAGLVNSGIEIATVCGFPSGSHQPSVKAYEAANAAQNGATEIDMVLDLGRVKSGDWASVTEDVATVRAAIDSPLVLKVIIESAALTDDEIVRCCEASEAAGADYVKTSTGFHPSGGATLAAVSLMAKTVGDRLGVKASGGIRSTQAALDMAAAGATRLGTSSTVAILGGAQS